MATETISAGVASFFEQAKLMGPATNGKRTVFVSALFSPSVSRASSSSRNISSASFSATFASQPQSTIDVPEELESVELASSLASTLQLPANSGPTSRKPPKAISWRSPGLISDSPVPDAMAPTDDWTSVLEGLGINHTLQAAILLPPFPGVRVTRSCKYWVSESMEVTFIILKHLDGQLREELLERKGAKKGTKGQRSHRGPASPLRRL